MKNKTRIFEWQNLTLMDTQDILIEKCLELLNERHTKASLYKGMKITAPELNSFLDGEKPTDKLLAKVASHPLINLEVVKSYTLIKLESK
tara:strand:- start:2682 stop:2951 length:270 start_codon:yes stop_codon:yes gene_type:complete